MQGMIDLSTSWRRGRRHEGRRGRLYERWARIITYSVTNGPLSSIRNQRHIIEKATSELVIQYSVRNLTRYFTL